MNKIEKFDPSLNIIKETISYVEPVVTENAEAPLDPLTVAKKKIVEYAASQPDSEYSTEELIKSFALLHGDAFISGTKYEGGQADTQAAYWHNCLTRWQTGNALCPPKFDPTLIGNIASELEEFQELSHLMYSPSYKEAVRKKIVNTLKVKGKCVLPLGIRGPLNGVGHAFCCVIERSKEGTTTVTILNSGDGSGMHPLAHIDTHQKNSFFFLPLSCIILIFLRSHLKLLTIS